MALALLSDVGRSTGLLRPPIQTMRVCSVLVGDAAMLAAAFTDGGSSNGGWRREQKRELTTTTTGRS